MGGSYGLLGERLGHSYSPAIHAALADYDYRLYEVPREELDAFLTRREFDGLNVTIPYKKAVIPYCAALSPIAAELGSVNVLLRRPDGTLLGDNTDAYGFAGLVRRSGIDPADRKALVLGSGGARARHLLLGSAARKRAGAGSGDGGQATELEQVAARNVHSVGHDGSLSLTRDAELL